MYTRSLRQKEQQDIQVFKEIMAKSKRNLVGKKLAFQNQELEETPIMIKQKKIAPKNTVVKLLGKKQDKAVREKDTSLPEK